VSTASTNLWLRALALRAMQCRNGIASGIARVLGLVSGALRRLEGLKVAS